MIDLGNTPAAPTPTLSEQAQIRFALGIKQLAIVNPATNIAAFLEEPTSQRLADALVDENGDGPLAFANNGTHSNATLGGTLTINSTTINLGAGVADSIKDALGLGDLQDVLDSKADISNPVRTTLTGNGTQTVFAISGAGTLSNPSALIVAIDGALQEPSVDYTVGGGNITFTDPLASGAKAVVIAPSNSIQVGELIPSDGSVTSAKLAPNLTLTNATFGGTAAFTGTARPTSAAVGSPAATDLITRADADARYSTLEVYRLLLTSNTSAPDNISVNSTQSLVLPAGQYMFDAIVVAETTSTTAGLNAVFNFTDNSFNNFQCVFRVMTFPQSSFNVARGLQEIALRNGSQILPDVAVCFFDGGTNNLSSSSKANGIVTLSASKTVVGQVRQRMATNATVMVSGRQYKIQTVGTTDYTLVGSPNNTVGTVFTATGPATGTGTVWDFSRPAILRAGSYIEFRRIA